MLRNSNKGSIFDYQLNETIMKTTKKTIKTEVPAHIKMIAAQIEANAKKFGFTITDVTPKGYGAE